MKYKIYITAENRLGVLYRIADLFLRKRINIDRLIVGPDEKEEGVSVFRIEIECNEDIVMKLVRQMERIVEVRFVEVAKM